EFKSKIKGLCLLSYPHPADTARGGSAVLVRNHIQRYEEAEYGNQLMQVTTITIQARNKELKVAAIYCPPRNSPTREDYINLFKILGNHFVIGGDYNAKHTYWGSRLITGKGKEFYLAGKKYKSEFISSGSPTYWPSDPMKTPDLIDFFIVKGISSNYIIVGKEDLSSDHTPVILTITEEIAQKESIPKLCSKKTDWDKFGVTGAVNQSRISP
ncbi:rna-directed dna polymerase from mobile element jockey-like protein, partial [Lasius niger]